jgi:AraC-like DNA-binding protein
MDGDGDVRQRATVVAELPRLLAELGVEPDRVFAGTGVSPGTLGPETRMPFAACVAILSRAAEVSGRPEIGLLLGRRFRLDHHGAIGELMRTSATLGDALRAFVAWQPGYSSGAVVFLHADGGMTAFGNAVCSTAARPGRAYLDVVLGIGLRMVELLTDGGIVPEEVHMAVRPPADRAPYRRLGVPVHFERPLTCLFLPTSALSTPIATHDPVRHDQILARMAAARGPGVPGAGVRVRGALRKLLLVGKPTMAAVAGELAMHPRTLRRRLKAEGLVFDDLRDEVRLASALELLELTDLPVGEIAATLSYASPGVFAEAFRRMRGTSPSEWRVARARAG